MESTSNIHQMWRLNTYSFYVSPVSDSDRVGYINRKYPDLSELQARLVGMMISSLDLHTQDVMITCQPKCPFESIGRSTQRVALLLTGRAWEELWVRLDLMWLHVASKHTPGNIFTKPLVFCSLLLKVEDCTWSRWMDATLEPGVAEQCGVQVLTCTVCHGMLKQ